MKDLLGFFLHWFFLPDSESKETFSIRKTLQQGIPLYCLLHILKSKCQSPSHVFPDICLQQKTSILIWFYFKYIYKENKRVWERKACRGKGEGTRRQNRSCLRKNNMKPGGSLIWQFRFCILSSLEGWKLWGLMVKRVWTWSPKEPLCPGCQGPAQESSNPWIMQGNFQQPKCSTRQALMSEQEAG